MTDRNFARESMLAAAAHIEQHPDQFYFYESKVPSNARSEQACALGWTGHFQNRRESWLASVRAFFSSYGKAEHRQLGVIARSLGFAGERHFYQEMFNATRDRGVWTRDAALTAAGMRELAARI